MNTEFIKLFDDKEVPEQIDVSVQYILVKCKRCSHTWGVVIDPTHTISKRKLVCRDCAADLVAKQM